MRTLWTGPTVALALGVVLVLFVSSLPTPGAASSASEDMAAPVTKTLEILPRATQSPIKHVIIAIYENHGVDNEFSQLPGVFSEPPGGVPQPTSQQNVTAYNTPYFTNWNYAGNESSDVPDHDVTAVIGNMDNGSMDGYSYTDSNVSDAMFPAYIMPNINGLAEEYGLADMYFQAFSGPTMPNRFYDYADTSGIILGDLGSSVNGTTVYFPSMPQELETYGLSWASFDGAYDIYNSTCVADFFCNDASFYFITTLSQLMPMLYFNWIQQYEGQAGHLQTYSNLFSDITSGTLPAVSWYTPDWLCCTEHPGTIAGFGGNITQGEQSILQLVSAVEESQYWNSTAIFITYDEGGGFYDHVPAPQMTSLGDGGRIPLVVISPYSKEGYVSHTYYTPSSLLRFIEWNWNLPPLGTLDREANNPLDFFNFSAAPRPALPPSQLSPPNNESTFPWALQSVNSSFSGAHYVSPLVADGNVSWAQEATNTIVSSPTLSPNGAAVYVSGMDSYLRAYNSLTGQPLWSRSLGNASRSAPTVTSNGTIIATTLGGVIFAYSPSGNLLWQTELWTGGVHAPTYGGLTLNGGVGYGALQNGTAFALSLSTGHVLWERQISTVPLYSAPVLASAKGPLLFSVSARGVVATNLTGSTLWTTGIPGGVWSGGIVDLGNEYVAGTEGGLYVLNISTGAVTSSKPLFRGTIASPMLDGSTLIVGTTAGNLTAFTIGATGVLTSDWTSSVYGAVASPGVVQGNDVWVATEGGDLDQIDPSTGAVLSSYHSDSSMWASPAVSPAGLYFTAEDGGVYAVVTGGEIQVTVTPTAATVHVNGQLLALNSAGQGETPEPAGSATVTANYPGDVNASQTATVNKGAVTNVYINLTHSPTVGVARGTVSPATATVTIQGTPVCSGSCATYSVQEAPGTYELVASAPSYETQFHNVTLVAGATTWWNFTLVATSTLGWLVGTVTNGSAGPGLAALSASLEPGNISVVTSSSGTFNITLAPGTYSLFLNASHFKPFSTTDLTITSGKTTTTTVVLTPVQGTGPGNGGGTSGGGNSSTSGVLGLGTLDWLLIALVLVLVIVAVAVLSRRRGSQAAQEWPEPPPAETAPAVWAEGSTAEPPSAPEETAPVEPGPPQ